MNPALAEAIDALLPQTQCTRCGYAACRPYADALAMGATELNRCPPGGEPTISALARLLGREPLPLDPDCGTDPGVAMVARVIEEDCIGCTKCIQACPVDAIIGAANLMHMVITAQCTGCELCLEPCPVDCIVMEAAPALPLARQQASQHRLHFTAQQDRQRRRAREEADQRRRLTPASQPDDPVAMALARARGKPMPPDP